MRYLTAGLIALTITLAPGPAQSKADCTSQVVHTEHERRPRADSPKDRKWMEFRAVQVVKTTCGNTAKVTLRYGPWRAPVR